MKRIKKSFVQFLVLLIVFGTINLQPRVFVYADDADSPIENPDVDDSGNPVIPDIPGDTGNPVIPDIPGDTGNPVIPDIPGDTDDNDDSSYDDAVDTSTPPALTEPADEGNSEMPLPTLPDGITIDSARPDGITISFDPSIGAPNEAGRFVIPDTILNDLVNYLDSVYVEGTRQTIEFHVPLESNIGSGFNLEMNNSILSELKKSHPGLTLKFSSNHGEVNFMVNNLNTPPDSSLNIEFNSSSSSNDEAGLALLLNRSGFNIPFNTSGLINLVDIKVNLLFNDTNTNLPLNPLTNFGVRIPIPNLANLNNLGIRRFDDFLNSWVPVGVPTLPFSNDLASNQKVSLAFDSSNNLQPENYIEFSASQSGKFAIGPIEIPSFKDANALTESEKALLLYGIVKGTTDGKLNRKEDMKYTDFIVMILRSLGLEQGSANGYNPLQLALDYKLIDKLPDNPKAAITIGESVTIYNNALRYDALRTIGSNENSAQANGISQYSVATTAAIAPTTIKSKETLATNSINSLNTSGISMSNLQSMDIETALMAVQGQRASLLESQLQDQISAVQAKNDQVSKLNNLLSAVRTIQAKGELNDSDGGITLTDDELNLLQNRLQEIGASYSISQEMQKADLDKLIENIKSQIDGLANSQQMDMLRLQSLSNKRNEAFDVMTNFVKKMQDNRSSIIGNMR
ncbi:hypothetical protein DCE79_02635 [Lysinibacillus sp. 2017]|uniref:hypothetical protein n=1 Tax=unclassified Lysinibacillus TaxID=2636778 RepID=UPI000D52715B|nr:MULTISPECIES: hypothetical protein [unclassified Lysinibacillus]AWE06346.1 hypothetical protein DCE79_02635 [Lysinibacillus sp. 2017]TGN35034.1 hypothetical protein E4L99_11765 [Lysinibacillus sp. S2017]